MKQQVLAKFFPFAVYVLLYLTTSIECRNSRRQKIVVPGDLIIGALIPVHEQPSYTEINSKQRCGKIRDQYGVQRVEALLYLLDKLNNKNITKILPGIKLGIDIRDECWESSIALEETIDFIKDTIGSTTIDNYENESSENSNTNNTSYELSPIENSRAIVPESCLINNQIKNHNKIMAVVGPSGSSIAINVQNLLQLFDIPQIGFSATSADLSNKKLYKTFMRVVPSDYLQVRAMVDVVIKMNWTYLFAIYTDGSYGQAGMEAFRNETLYLNMCLVEYEKIKEYASDEDYELVIKKLNKTTNATVIVCFCYGETVRGLLIAMNKLNLKGRFLILGSDGWSDRIDVAKGYYEEALGSFSIKAYSLPVKQFDGYFQSLKPSNNLRNVWFKEYWQERFKCHIDEDMKYEFPEPCKRKCPHNFKSFKNSCYSVSTDRILWQNAQLACKQKNFRADLVDFNDIREIRNAFEYIYESKPGSEFNAFHISLNMTHYQESDSLKFKFCDDYSIFKLDWRGSNLCPYVVYEDSVTKKNARFCIKLDDCVSEQFFVCKLSMESSNNANENELDYADTLHSYQQDPKMSYVMNSLLALAYGLDRVHLNICNGVKGMCEKMKKVNGSVILKNLREVEFTGITGETINFDHNGDPPGRYVILNVQRDPKSPGNYIYKEVGSWENDNFKLDLNQVYFPNGQKNFRSRCSEDCSFGYVKQIRQGCQKSCWNCKRCEAWSFIVDEYTCHECPYGYWPTQNLTGCYKLPIEYQRWSDASSIVTLIVSFIGVSANTFILVIFIKYSNTCVVKSTTKELSYIILSGTYICYLMNIPLLMKPSIIPCYLSRILPGLGLSLIYGALITKTNRISRILSQSKKKILTKKPRFMSLTAQIIITLIIISIECGFIVTSILMQPDVSVITYPQRDTPRLQCFTSTLAIIAPLGYNIFLVFMCTFYAVKTRNLPENFNEAKFIGFSMYTTCVIWLAFIPIYFGSDFKIITQCLSTSFSATVILIFRFFPKVYIILFHPERNQRSAFATTKDLRIHFGNNARSNSSIENERRVSKSVGSKNASLLVSHTGKDSVCSSSINRELMQNDDKLSSSLRSNFTKKGNNKSVDNSESSNSLNHFNDRSCQTSQELLVPLLEKQKMKNVKFKFSFKDNKSDESEKETHNSTTAKEKVKKLEKILKSASTRLPNVSASEETKKPGLYKSRGKRATSARSPNEFNPLHVAKSATKSFSRTVSGDPRVNEPKKYSKDNYKVKKDSITNLQRIDEQDKASDRDISSDSDKGDALDNGNESSLQLDDATKMSELTNGSVSMDSPNFESFKPNFVNEDIEDELMMKLEHEDESLENLKKLISSKSNGNLVLNWDYVQSSDYL